MPFERKKKGGARGGGRPGGKGVGAQGKGNHVISWKFIYRPYMVRSLSMPFSLSMGAFNVNFFV